MTESLPELLSSAADGCSWFAMRYWTLGPRSRPAFTVSTVAGRNLGTAFSATIIINRYFFELEGQTKVFENVGARGLRSAVWSPEARSARIAGYNRDA